MLWYCSIRVLVISFFRGHRFFRRRRGGIKRVTRKIKQTLNLASSRPRVLSSLSVIYCYIKLSIINVSKKEVTLYSRWLPTRDPLCSSDCENARKEYFYHFAIHPAWILLNVLQCNSGILNNCLHGFGPPNCPVAFAFIIITILICEI
jgi:hypothetical protein